MPDSEVNAEMTTVANLSSDDHLISETLISSREPKSDLADNQCVSPSVNQNVIESLSTSLTSASVTSIPVTTSSSAITEKTAIDDSNTSDLKEIATLVFFDLETTGLGYFVGKSNVQITEISMIAVDKKEFQISNYPDLRDVRIIHKLSLCVRPRSPISPMAAKITGLNDSNLEGQQPFDQNAAQMIISFLSHLQKPVCILAHNGGTFDYPLLKAEFKRLALELPLDLRIADSLYGMRSVGIPELPFDQKPTKAVIFKNGRLSLSLENLHVYFFGKKPYGSHSSEGDCITLAKICHKMRDKLLPWVDKHSKSFDTVKPMW
ncbi:three-prime repair exonuclease 1-like [Stegodyphus dumicola]|uniref:three-prime repair exonuclease 1-like n=1 Tax=Stegodyphus dumicola TaxID=202533 RepID=UPI0015A8B033|nr:three-prime repair exonuclease 1-like [Stegodyphus dumicola]